MCEPVSASILVGTSLLGGLMGAQGAQMEAQAERRAALFNASALREQAALTDLQVGEIQEAGRQEVRQLRQARADAVSQGRLAYAAGGVALDSASPMIWEAGVRDEVAADVEAVEESSRRRVRSARREARQLRLQSDFQLGRAGHAVRAGRINAFTSLLGGASRAAGAFL